MVITPHDVARARRLLKHLESALGDLDAALAAEGSEDRARRALSAAWGLSYVAEAIGSGALNMAVDVARGAGASWSQVGEHVCTPAGDRYEACARRGVSKQAAAKRFGSRTPPAAEPGPSLLDALAEGLHRCEGCGLELDADDTSARCSDCSPAALPRGSNRPS